MRGSNDGPRPHGNGKRMNVAHMLIQSSYVIIYMVYHVVVSSPPHRQAWIWQTPEHVCDTDIRNYRCCVKLLHMYDMASNYVRGVYSDMTCFRHIYHTFACVYTGLWPHGNTSCIFPHMVSVPSFFSCIWRVFSPLYKRFPAYLPDTYVYIYCPLASLQELEFAYFLSLKASRRPCEHL